MKLPTGPQNPDYSFATAPLLNSKRHVPTVVMAVFLLRPNGRGVMGVAFPNAARPNGRLHWATIVPHSVRWPLVCYVFSESEAPREWATRLVGAEALLSLFLFRFLFLWYPVAGCPTLTKRQLDIRYNAFLGSLPWKTRGMAAHPPLALEVRPVGRAPSPATVLAEDRTLPCASSTHYARAGQRAHFLI